MVDRIERSAEYDDWVSVLPNRSAPLPRNREEKSAGEEPLKSSNQKERHALLFMIISPTPPIGLSASWHRHHGTFSLEYVV